MHHSCTLHRGGGAGCRWIRRSIRGSSIRWVGGAGDEEGGWMGVDRSGKWGSGKQRCWDELALSTNSSSPLFPNLAVHSPHVLAPVYPVSVYHTCHTMLLNSLIFNHFLCEVQYTTTYIYSNTFDLLPAFILPPTL